MDYLTPEILDIVAEHCGAHEQGSLDRARLARVVKQAAFPILPIKDGICVVNVQLLGTLAADLHAASMNVYDVASGTIVPVAIRHLEWKMTKKPFKKKNAYSFQENTYGCNKYTKLTILLILFLFGVLLLEYSS
jgi:hypothetical protein